MLAVNTNLLRKNSLDSVDNESTPNSKFQLKKSGSSKKHLQQQLLSMRQISKKKVFSRDNSANIVTDTTTGNTGITGLSNTTVTAGTGVVDTPITNMLLPLQRNNKQQQASREYKFSCHGEIITKELDDNDFIRKVGKHIEWKATFDKPLEQLLYPSLQRFDTTERDKKRKIHEKIHGYSPINESNSNNKNHTTTNRTMENLLTTSSTDFTNHHNSYSNSISNSNSIDDKLFLHTPSWTAIITNNENPTTPNGSKIFTNKNIKKTLLEEIEYDGEEYLRKKLQKSYLEGNTKEKIQHRQQLYTPSIPTPSSKGNNRRGQAKNLIKAAQELETAEQLVRVIVFLVDKY